MVAAAASVSLELLLLRLAALLTSCSILYWLLPLVERRLASLLVLALAARPRRWPVSTCSNYLSSSAWLSPGDAAWWRGRLALAFGLTRVAVPAVRTSLASHSAPASNPLALLLISAVLVQQRTTSALLCRSFAAVLVAPALGLEHGPTFPWRLHWWGLLLVDVDWRRLAYLLASMRELVGLLLLLLPL